MIELVIEIAKNASSEIMQIYNSQNFEIELKNDNSPVTKADITSHNIIIEGLKRISEYPILSEEDVIPYEIREKWTKFWLVDPLDGTKDFIAKNGQFTINIALIDNEKPVLGVVYIPYSDDVYYAQINNGAFKNGKRIFNKSARIDLIAADSNFHSTHAMKDFFKLHNIKNIKKIGSSIKICKLAEGKIDVYPRLNETKEWDTAATHIIANEAGCKLIDIKTKNELKYNKKSYKNNFFIASRNNLEF